MHPKDCLFVCEHGSVKSLVAASYFNQRARERRLPFEAVARGTAPQPTVPRVVRDGLRSIGMDVSGYEPQRFAESDISAASLVVSFDQNVDSTVGARVPHLKWDHLPSVLSDYSRGRDAIVAKIDSLLDELAKVSASRP